LQHNVDEATQSIALLNDQARTTLTNCKLIITRGIDLLGAEAVDCILHLVMRFDDFSERNDPFSEHDFGAIEYEGNTVFWKINYFDLDLINQSPDPSDPHVTRRVLTIMLGEEY
jgi:hypothetical protein